MFGSEKFFGSGGGAAAFYTQELGNSLKFEDGDNSYLSRTPASAGNRKTWTWSGWFKRGNITNDTHTIWRAYGTSGSTGDYIQLMSDDTLSLSSYSGGYQWRLRTSAVFRDTSSWYHIVVSIDTTQSTSSDRAKLYVNGEQTTAFSVETYPSSSYDTYTNTASAHYIGHRPDVTDQFDGYLAEINFIDGTALDPTSFGETKEGIWIPKDVSGLTYGTNGFRLPFTETTTANGFNTVTWSGTTAVHSVNGVGFQPDFIWIKCRSATPAHQLFDSVRGSSKRLGSDTTAAEITDSTDRLLSFDSDGFSMGGDSNVNLAGRTYVGWCWGGGTNDKTYTVTVVDDSGNKYRFDGHGTSSIALNLTEGATYTFNYPSAHPLRFSTTSDGTHGGGSEYTTGVTYVSSTQVKITVASGAPVLYYYCSLHSGMGGQINTNTTDGPTHAEGTILSRVKPNADYGFSITSYTGNGTSGATIGHGLNSVPKLIIIKERADTGNWVVYNAVSGNTKYLYLNTTAAEAASSSAWNNTSPTSTVFTVGNSAQVNQNSNTHIAYCFADVTGYQKIGSYSGTGSSGNAITGLGFKPAWLLIKRTDSTGAWQIFDTTRDPDGNMNKYLYANASNVEASDLDISSDADGFTVNSTNNALNNASGTYIYLAIADTRDALFTSDASSNSNNWTPNDLQHSDVMPDTPTDGFAVMNPLYGDGGTTWKEGNLELSTANKGNNTSTFFMESGKWYWEAMGEGYVGAVCAFDKGQYNDSISVSGSDSIGYYTNGTVYWGTGSDGTPATYTSSDIIGVALNMDDGQISFYKNNTLQVTLNFSSTISRLATEGCYACYNNGSSSTAKVVNFNFGQDSSFNAKEIAQGNADGNGKGDFYYAPPSGYLALCNANLPDPAIDPNAGENPEDYFNTVLYTGNGSSQSITGVGFQPDFVWTKQRSGTDTHALYDVVRVPPNVLYTSETNSEETSSAYVNQFDADGFTVGAANLSNESGQTYVAWNWLAGGTGVSNTDGSITSTVSANTDAGFSIVAYTGTGSAATVGHGLGVAPDMIIVKNRAVTSNFITYHSANTSAPETDYLMLNSTAATADASSVWNDTSPTSSVFTVGNSSNTNGSSNNMIAYCFAEKIGYSKFGVYYGNGSTDGPFVYTGFRPAFVIVKRTDTVEQWHIHDSARSSFNQVTKTLYANLQNAETDSTSQAVDFVSNGLKIRTSNSGLNASGGTYIYIAFAEQPFKYSNAR